jgi:hypothetical protein
MRRNAEEIPSGHHAELRPLTRRSTCQRLTPYPCRMNRTIRLLMHQGTTMHPSPPSPSPLDDGLRQFLRHVRDTKSGFSPGRQSREAAAALDLPEAFVEALFTSARTRGLLKPDPLGRGKLRWTVSAMGERFLEAAPDSANPSAS